MAEATTMAAKFGCPSCGRQFTWKPELAGKAAKCKCGATITVPAKPQAAAPNAGAAPAAGAARRPAARPATAPPPPPPPAVEEEGNPLDAYDFNEVEASAPPPRAPVAAPVVGMGVAGAFGAPRGPQPVSRDAGGKADVGGIVKMIAIPVVLLAVVGGAVFGFRKLSGNKADLGPDKGKDRQVRAMMAEDGATELKEWLKNGGSRRMVMGMTVQQAAGLADRLYNMGAVKIYAFGGVVTASLAIELPQDADKRNELFEWQKRWHTDMYETPQTDVGQQYLLIKMRV